MRPVNIMAIIVFCVVILTLVGVAIVGIVSGGFPAYKSNVEVISPEQLHSPILVSQGYLIKDIDVYGRQTWRIGTQVVNPIDEFCILGGLSSDIFSRNPISMLRTDQFYKLYSCEFRRTDSSRKGSWIEVVWGIEAVTDNSIEDKSK